MDSVQQLHELTEICVNQFLLIEKQYQEIEQLKAFNEEERRAENDDE